MSASPSSVPVTPAVLEPLVRCLADGRLHSGADLAAAAGVAPGAVSDRIAELRALGLEVRVEDPGPAYRLPAPLDLLDAGAIARALATGAAATPGVGPAPGLAALEVRFAVDSTNRVVAAALRAGEPAPRACLAEYQSAGRGRRGRAWISPPGASLMLSVGWRFDGPPAGLAGLGLALGVAAAEALAAAGPGAEAIGLKWPNDLVCGGRKLGGVLVEAGGVPGRPVEVVAGIGINVALPRDAGIDQPWTDLATVAGAAPARTPLAARLLGAWLRAWPAFGRGGFACFAERYAARDRVRGREVEVRGPGGPQAGRALGVDRRGGLLLDTGRGVETVVAGEVTLRLASRPEAPCAG